MMRIFIIQVHDPVIQLEVDEEIIIIRNIGGCDSPEHQHLAAMSCFRHYK